MTRRRLLLRWTDCCNSFSFLSQVTEGVGDISVALGEVTRLLDHSVGGDVELILLSEVISRSSALSLRDGKLINAGKQNC